VFDDDIQEITVDLRDPQTEQLDIAVSGDTVSLWLSPDARTVKVFRRGTLGGQGWIGSTSNRALAAHLANGLPTYATIDKTRNKPIVRCTLVSQTKVERDREAQVLATLNDLRKPYKPAKGFELRARAEIGSDLVPGDRLQFQQYELEEYCRRAMRLEFICRRSDVAVWCTQDIDRIRRLLKAVVNGYSVLLVVTKILSKPVGVGDDRWCWEETEIIVDVQFVKIGTAAGLQISV